MLNCWELLTHAEHFAPPYKHREIREMIVELSSRSVSGQEFSIGTTERGWLLKVHSCYSDMEVLILVPSDPKLPVEIVTDTRGK